MATTTALRQLSPREVLGSTIPDSFMDGKGSKSSKPAKSWLASMFSLQTPRVPPRSSRIVEVEKALLDEITSSLDPSGKLNVEQQDVKVDFKGAEALIHHISVSGKEESKDGVDVVILPGYGGGALMFAPNAVSLASRAIEANARVGRVFVVDWLGTGASSRPSWPSDANSVEETEDFFLDAFEQWRKKMDVNDAVVVGHSFGGYLGASYMLRKYDPATTRVRALVLASPVGVPEKPAYDPSRKLPAAWRFVRYLWNAGWTPQTVVRAAGPLGKGLVRKAIKARFGGDETMNMAGVSSGGLVLDYMHAITSAKGSGEHALSRILLPGAYAKRPLVSRMGAMPSAVPVKFLYGAHDWMKPVDSLRDAHDIRTIPRAGHHLYIDNAPAFESNILAAIMQTR